MSKQHRTDEQLKMKGRLEATYGTTGHPKADELFDLAWGYGHSFGEVEIESFYEEMMGLLPDYTPSAREEFIIKVGLEYLMDNLPDAVGRCDSPILESVEREEIETMLGKLNGL